MQFEKGYIYHLYNQGNNRQLIFKERENYLFFLRKVHEYVLPYTDILAWCLMPNHFHMMVLAKETERIISEAETERLETERLTQSEPLSNTKIRTFNDSIGIMLRTYTRAYNKRYNFSGALFRPKTKAECINCPHGITPSFVTKDGITKILNKSPEQQYPQVCFEYIHQNPVKARLVKKTYEWEFSSAADYAGLRQGKLVNKILAAEYVQVTPVSEVNLSAHSK